MTDYLTELRRLTATCKFGNFLDEAFCDRLVCGLRNEAVQCRLLVESDLTLAKAFELAQRMEATEENAKEIQSTDLSSSVQVVAPQRNS